MIYSATRGKLALAGDGPEVLPEAPAAVLRDLGVVVLVAMAVFDYRKWEQLATVLYVGIVVALLAVLSPVGSPGARFPAVVPARARSSSSRPSSPPWC